MAVVSDRVQDNMPNVAQKRPVDFGRLMLASMRLGCKYGNPVSDSLKILGNLRALSALVCCFEFKTERYCCSTLGTFTARSMLGRL